MKDNRNWFRRYRSWRKACKAHAQLDKVSGAEAFERWLFHLHRLEQTCPYDARKMVYVYGGLPRG